MRCSNCGKDLSPNLDGDSIIFEMKPGESFRLHFCDDLCACEWEEDVDRYYQRMKPSDLH